MDESIWGGQVENLLSFGGKAVSFMFYCCCNWTEKSTYGVGSEIVNQPQEYQYVKRKPFPFKQQQNIKRAQQEPGKWPGEGDEKLILMHGRLSNSLISQPQSILIF